jgi:xylulokinase
VSFLGLDVGTTGCKAMTVDESGKLVALAYRDYPLVCPKPGWNELDSKSLWNSIGEVLFQVSRQTRSDPVKSLSVSCQGEAVAPIGKNGSPLSNFIVTFDNRAKAQCRWWEERLGRKGIFAVTGMPLHPMYSINKIMWLKENRPDLYKQAWKFLCIEDFVILTLSGRAVIDYSLAARTMCFDVTRKTWAEEILRCAGISEDMLAEPRPSGLAVGRILAAKAEELGLPPDVVIATGGHDQPCGALGAGAVRPGVTMNAIGTSDVLCPFLQSARLDGAMLESNYCCYPHVMPDAYVSITFNLTGGLLLRWYRDTLCQEEIREAALTSADPYELIIARASPEPANVFILPHFVGSGTPTLDAGSRGAIVGLTLGTTKGEISRAVLDSNNYDLKLNAERLEQIGVSLDEIRVIGGGAKSSTWLKLRADVLGKRVCVPAIPEAASLGAAILGAVGAGHFPTPRAGADAWVKTRSVVEPDERMHERYRDKYRNYLKLYPALKSARIEY